MYTPEQILQKIWLQKNEQNIFLACMEYWGLTVTWLQRNIDLPRTTIYDTLQKLEMKWFITKSKRRNTLTFYAIDTQEIVALLQDKIQQREQRKHLMQKNIPAFQAMMKWTNIMPQVKMYQWKDALSIIYHQVKQTKSVKTIFSVEITNEFWWEHTVDDIHETHQAHRIDKKILLIDSNKALTEKKRLLGMWFQVKILDAAFPVLADIMIMDEKMLFVSYEKQIQALEIVQPIFVQAQRVMFDSIRNTL
jgi:predicted transcriptional regulator